MKVTSLMATMVTGLVLALPTAAQDVDPLQAKFDKKISEPWVTHGGWITDLEEAKAIAAKENKVIFAYFTRSYSP
ncbi:MAG: hypothetical protein HQ519_04400 [Planctomycetes bacterium]|nr:hypothetical protein [Planctomycetota bacterium]